MTRQLAVVLVAVLAAPAIAFAQENPYACEGSAQEQARTASVAQIHAMAEAMAKAARTAIDHCLAAELYKLSGDTKARAQYEQAIAGDREEPAFELLYGVYLRLYRGAGQRPLFPDAEAHLLAARAKLSDRESGGTRKREWDKATADRLGRALTALYERDGIHLATREVREDDVASATAAPWLFFAPVVRAASSLADLDRSDEGRDLASGASFSASRVRLARPLTPAELSGLARTVTPIEVGGTLRMRRGAAPMLDVSLAGRHAGNAQVTDFYHPNVFNDLRLTDVGVGVEKPFTIGASLDALAGVRADWVKRRGLIEFEPEADERVTQLTGSGALSHYVGPDRASLAFTYVRQRIDPDLPGMATRDREIAGGTATYQIFRPIFGRHVDTGLARHFEPRGIDLFAGLSADRERFPSSPADVFIDRRDYFVGVTARALGRFDATVQPTWYQSRVSGDPAQDNAQLRVAGTIVARLLDEERTAGAPKERLGGLPIAFVQLVVPYHWDETLEGVDAFRSRATGIELWLKFFSKGPIGVTTLAVVGYTRQRFPGLDKDFNLLRMRIGLGF